MAPSSQSAPTPQRHGKWRDCPVVEQCYTDTLAVFFHLMQGAEVHFQQHRDNHQPGQHRDRQVDLGDFQPAGGLEDRRQPVAECDRRDDAKPYPIA